MKIYKTLYKAALSLAATVLMSTGLSAQNDLCSNAIGLNCNSSVNGSTSGATVDNVGFCGTSNTAPGVWYLIAGNGSPITLSTCNNASYDTKISVFNGTCGALSCVGGADDATGCSGFTTEFTFNSVAGDEYLVLVHGFGSATGTFSLTASCAAAVANDDCSTAEAIACGQSINGSTDNANTDAVGTCVTSNSAPGVWYSVTGTGADMIASLCAGTTYDSKLSVFTGACGALTCVTGNDDFCGLQSEVEWNSTMGQTYYILVHGFGSSTGDFALSVDCPIPPANDNVCDAIAVGLGATAFTNENATAQAGEVSPGAGTGTSSCTSQDGWCFFETAVDNSVWFTFTAPASGCISIYADGFDSQLALWEVGDCADFSTYTELSANDDSGDDIGASNIFSGGLIETSCLTPGATYYIQVDGYNGAESNTGTLNITDCGNAPLAVDFGSCQSRYLGYGPAEMDTNFLYANATGGFAPYTYTYTPSGLFETTINGGNTGVLAVQPAATTTYTVTVTDDRGCSATSTVTVNVQDVSCGNNPNNPKVIVCHNGHTICISPNAVASHLGNHSGDMLGDCSNGCTGSNPSVPAPPACVDLTVDLTTDNFGGETSWVLEDQTTGMVIDEVFQGSLASNTNFLTSYCVDPTHCYTFRITDSFGDGICCSFGTGTYKVNFDGTSTLSPTGGAFGGGESIDVGMCTNMLMINGPNNGTQRSAAFDLSSEQALNVVAYPNPSSGLVNLKVSATQDEMVTLAVYDLEGRLVETIYNGNVEGGQTNVFTFDGNAMSSGVYIFRLVGTTSVETGKLYITK